MKTIDAAGLDFIELNEMIRGSDGDLKIKGCLGQRFIGAGQGGRSLLIEGVPGNALGAYLNGGRIEDHGTHEELLGHHGLYEKMWNAHMEVKDNG